MFAIINSLSTSERWFYGLIIAVIVSFVGRWYSNWLSHNSSVSRESSAILKTNSIDLRNSFNPELEKLRDLDAWHLGDTKNILLGAYDKHSKAAFEFISNTEGVERAKFREAWERYKGNEEYKEPANNFGVLKKDQKLIIYIAQSTEQENRDLAIKNIEHILSFIKI